METVGMSARALIAHTKLPKQGRIEVIRKRDYKRYPFFDGGLKWYIEQSPEGVITLIVDEAMYDEVSAMVRSSEEVPACEPLLNLSKQPEYDIPSNPNGFRFTPDSETAFNTEDFRK